MSHQQPQQQEEENILLPTAPNGTPNASFRRLWNSLTRINPEQISNILRMMNHRRLFCFLEFMHQICFHDPSIEYSQRQLEHYQTILRCCPRLILTEYLCSIDIRCRVNILKQCDDIWTMYFIGLFEVGNDFEVEMILGYLVYINEFDSISNIVLLLFREASNYDLPTPIRQNIFDFIYKDPNMNSLISEREYNGINEWMMIFSQTHGLHFDPSLMIYLQCDCEQPHKEVNADDFVRKTFIILRSPNPESICPICQLNPAETNCWNRWRRLPCCGQQQCHDCLVRQVSLSNEYDESKPSKPTDRMKCSLCNHEILFHQ